MSVKKSLFEYVKENVKISDFVRTLEQTKGLHSVGGSEYRCNNVIANGDGTTSMRIKDDEGYFKMFSHGQESGDVIVLYQETIGNGDNSYQSALNLAEYMGLPIPDEYTQQTFSDKPNMIKAMNSICEYTNKYLLESNNEDAVIARRYLKERGVSKKIVIDWKLGLFPSDYNDSMLTVQNIADKGILIKTNILDKKGKYVPMRGRLSFPIFSKKGDCIAFSSRQIDNIECFNESSKYINTSSTEIYDKSEVLYGQHLINRNIKNVIICEGNLDVIALNEVTPEDTIALATCGTALTESHIPLLKGIRADNYSIMFDSDKAGQRATIKLVWLVNHLNMVTISTINSGKDPWDAYKEKYDINKDIQFDESIVWSSPSIAAELFDEKEFSNWFKNAYKSLAYKNDRNTLFDMSVKYSGIRKNVLDKMISGVNKNIDSRRKSNGNIEFSSGVNLLIAALLTIKDVNERKFIAFPLIQKNRDRILELCGSENDIEDNAINIVLGDNRNRDDLLINKIYSLVKDTEEEENVVRESFCKYLALTIIANWKKNGIPPESYKYINSLSMISSGASKADTLDKMLFLFDISTIK